ncbi:MAG TPA: AAC(3) family N-acetyltransferase [Pyrinomonadaceae bacterium]|jgi:aminoglycoside 3-N-acetyltransferase|nr:AAC(3) family N-acetyltransferase [Pyrinomonadaceae bacterium]
MNVTQHDLRDALRRLGLAGRVVCLHSSLRSFGRVEGGAASVVGAFLEEDCTLLVPTFSSGFEVAPPPGMRLERNGWNYDARPAPEADSGRIYTPAAHDIDRSMGAIPAEVIARKGRVRGNHPFDSFAALGARAAELVSGQKPSDVYAPLVALARAGGFVLLAGVGLERMTLLHLAERVAGRTLFRRWARGAHGETIYAEAGGCSEGFGNLETVLRPIMRTTTVGESFWRLFPASETIKLAADAIRAEPRITLCDDASCERCPDAVAGGPILPGELTL